MFGPTSWKYCQFTGDPSELANPYPKKCSLVDQPIHVLSVLSNHLYKLLVSLIVEL